MDLPWTAVFPLILNPLVLPRATRTCASRGAVGGGGGCVRKNFFFLPRRFSHELVLSRFFSFFVTKRPTPTTKKRSNKTTEGEKKMDFSVFLNSPCYETPQKALKKT
jgi:hypothetical protein